MGLLPQSRCEMTRSQANCGSRMKLVGLTWGLTFLCGWAYSPSVLVWGWVWGGELVCSSLEWFPEKAIRKEALGVSKGSRWARS